MRYTKKAIKPVSAFDCESFHLQLILAFAYQLLGEHFLEYMDIAFVIPLKEEFDRLIAAFPIVKDYVEGTHFWVEVDTGVPEYKAVAILQDGMGKAAAARATDEILSKYNIGIVILAGIAGGLSTDVAIGDVCFSGAIFDILENTKIADGGKGKLKIEYNTVPFKTDALLSFSMKYSSLGEQLKVSFDDWQSQQYYRAASVIKGEFIGRNNKNENIAIPQIHEGSIVCGSVSKSDLYKSNVTTLDRKLLAIETEAGGVFSTTERRLIPSIVVRGICDYADKNKSRLEEQTGGNTRKIAMDNAATFIKLQFSNPQFQRYLEARRQSINGLIAASNSADALSKIVPNSLAAIRQDIHNQLNQLSPEYQGKSLGYRVPLPRVKYAASNATVSPALKNFDPVSILEAVTKHSVVFFSTPKTYPDNSLPWVIAAELTLIEIDGKQVIPIVIDGENIKPPNGTLRRFSEVDVECLRENDDVKIIFIIHNFDTSSRSRSDFLRGQLDQFKNSSSIILSKLGAKLDDASPMLLAVGAEKFEICEISFSELSAFFKRTFNLEEQQAGVLTLRLQSMFKKFDLNAHPSYFASLGNDVLTSLLKANRRSELIQLAVSGFLTFVVAGDKDNIVLSRTTRETFLKKFVYHYEFLKERFDEASLVQFVHNFAVEKDFEIDSLLFINSFTSRGIIHFEDGYAKISLPFIESYLLAEELTTREQDAISYFNIDDDEFDYPTFDIYCELNVSTAIANKIMERMRDGLERERNINSEKHILLTNEIKPASIDHPSRLKSLQDQLEKAVSDVITNRTNSSEKQQILDVAEKVENEARQFRTTQSIEESTDEDTKNSDDFQQLSRIWSIAIVLLGAGSEKLDRGPKRELSRLIVQASSLLIDKMLRTFPRAEFEKLKNEMKSDETIRSLYSLSEGEEIPETKRQLVGLVIEAYEFSLLGYPMRVILEQLGNLANQPVLRSSVSSVESDDPMEDLIARIWAAEIDASKEKKNLLAALERLPEVPFLRVSLSTYFMVRVFWNHWLPENRLALLDAADTSLKPINRAFDKGKYKRIIKAGDSDEKQH